MKKHINLNKKGISLVILVITLILMTILAGVITIQLMDINIMETANNNAGKINLKQAKSLATIAWTEACASGNFITREQYEEHVKKELIDGGINVDDYEIYADKDGVIIRLKGESLPEEPDVPTGPTVIIDTVKPTIEILLNKFNVLQGDSMTIQLLFADDYNIAEINLSVDDIILNGFEATKEISVEEDMRVLTLTNIQGDAGIKTITIKEGVLTDGSDNKSAETTSQEFILET